MLNGLLFGSDAVRFADSYREGGKNWLESDAETTLRHGSRLQFCQVLNA